MSEPRPFIHTPFTSTSAASNGDAYFLLPFSAVSAVIDGSSDGLNVLGSSGGSTGVIIDEQPFRVSATGTISTSAQSLLNVQDFGLSFDTGHDNNFLESTLPYVGATVTTVEYNEGIFEGSQNTGQNNQLTRQENANMQQTCHSCGYFTSDASAFNSHEEVWGSSRHFRCELCQSIFDQFDKLTAHERQCRSLKPYKCECGEMFNREINYTLHSATHNMDGGQLRCPLCQETFRRAASYRCHLKLHAVDDVLSCSICQEEFNTADELRRHCRTIHGGIKSTVVANVCKQCGATFKRPLELAEHLITHKKIKETLKTNYRRKRNDGAKGRTSGRYICEVCSKAFTKKNTLDRHRLIHTKERPFECKTCGKSFNQKGALMFHEAKHLSQKPHECSLCGAAFAQRGNLRTHVKRVHAATVAENERRLECPLCSCTFKSGQSLQAHLSRRHKDCLTGQYTPTSQNTQGEPDGLVQSHGSEEPVQPSIMREQQPTVLGSIEPCSTAIPVQQSMPNQDALPVVASVTGGRRNLECTFCFKCFNKRSDFDRHVRVHTGERPFACELCPLRFALRSTLNKHVQSVHLHLKGARCYVCWKELASSSSLAIHMRRHNRETFDCDRCSRKFYTKYNLHRHRCGVAKSARKGAGKSTGAVLAPEYGGMAPIGQRFRSNQHVRSLDKTRPFFCRVGQCGRRFVRAGALREHLLIHSGVRPHKCNICNKAFRTRRCLTRHSVVHSDPSVRPFACPHCGKRFKRGVPCRQHMKTHNTAQPAPTVDNTTDNFCSVPVPPAPAVHSDPFPIEQTPVAGYSNWHTADDTAPLVPHQTAYSTINAGDGQWPADNCIPMDTAPAGWAQTTQAHRPSTLPLHTPAAVNDNHSAFYGATEPYHHSGTGAHLVAPAPTPYTCPECGQQFARAIHLTRHVYHDHPSAPDPINTHTMNMTGQLPVAPINCDYPVATHEHNTRPTDATTRSCPCCGKNFKKPSDLIRHIRIHTDERPFECECGRAFRVKSALMYHKQTHERNRAPMVRCQVCNSMFASRGALKVHLRQHTNEKAYQCAQCPEGFQFAAQLRSHVTKIHASPQPPAPSAAVDPVGVAQPSTLSSADSSAFTQVAPGHRVLSDNDRLALNITHHGDNEWQLNVRRVSSDDQHGCAVNGVVLDVSFLRDLASQGLTLSIPVGYDGAPETSLTLHPALLLEQGLREPDSTPFTVNDRRQEPPTPSTYLAFPGTAGDQVAETSSVMEKSALASQPSFIVECKICDLKFSNVHESRTHFQSPDHETAMNVQRETNGPLHMCDTCGKMFATRIRLRRHIRSHTGERPFQCTVCGECFSQSSSLKKHYVSKHTDIRPFACPHCDRRFALKYNLTTHIGRAHGQSGGGGGNVVAVEPGNSRQRVRTYLLSL